MKQPNLLFIFADQMRGFDMGCAGNQEVQTPNLDRLAAEGAMVRTAFANCPVCGPSRSVILTGRYPLASRVVANDLPLPEEIPSLASFAHDAGYTTGYIGKWHLEGVPRDKWTPPGPRRHGFDYWAAFNCSHRYFQGKYQRDTPEVMPLPGYEPEGQTDLAVQFLKHQAEKPFCLFVSYGPPHDPYNEVPEEFQQIYDPNALSLRGNVQPLQTDYRDPARKLGPEKCLALYYAAITALDKQVGRLLETLEQAGHADNTIVVFTADHGDMLFSQGMLKKQQPYEESIRIPFIIRWKDNIAPGSQPDVLLSTVDFVPTLAAMMGISVSDEIQGNDLSPALLGKGGDAPESVFLMEMVTTDEGVKQGIVPWRGVRTVNHTYAVKQNGEPWLMFDNIHDPFQTNNLINDKRFTPLQKELQDTLQSWLEQTDDRIRSGEELLREEGLVPLWNLRESELNKEEAHLL